MEQQAPPGQGGSEPGSVAGRAFSEGGDQIEVGLRQLAEEQGEAATAEAVVPSVATAAESRQGGLGGRFKQIMEKLKGIKPPSIPKPHLPHVSMPNFPKPHIEMPSIPRPDLSGVGEAIDKNRVGGFLKHSAESYLNKFDPRDKNLKAWASGIAGGVGSVVAFAEFGATLGLTPVLRGITAAAIIHGSNAIYDRLHTVYISRAIGGFDKSGARYLNPSANMAEIRGKVIELEKSIASQKLTGQAFVDEYRSKLDELLSPYINQGAVNEEASRDKLAQKLLDRLVKLGTDYAVVNSTAKSLAAGMAVGSFTAALGEAGVRTLARGTLGTLGEHFGVTGRGVPAAEAPAATAPAAPDAPSSPTPPEVQPTPPAPPAAPPEAPVAQPVTVPSPEAAPLAPSVSPESPLAPSGVPPSAEIQEKMADIQKSTEYQVEIAAEVGKYVEARDQIVEQALKVRNIVPAEVDATSFEAGKEAALHVMEGKGNEIFEKAAKEVLTTNPDADLSQIADTAQKAYADWLASEAAQTQLAEAAQKAVADHLQIEDALAQKVTNGLAASPDWVKDVPLEQGATAGKILGLTWTPADASVMGANIAANYDMLTEMWANMAEVHPDLLNGTTFPVSLSQLSDLVERAEAGDEEATKKLREALHWIPAGSKFRVVLGSASKQFLQQVLR